jgi:trimeric autotransporter adhesin
MKKTLPFIFRTMLIAGMFILGSIVSRADHIVGMDIGYTWLGGSDYKVSLIVYGDCSSGTFASLSTAAPRICIYRRATSVTNITLAIEAPTAGVEITPVCPASIGMTTCSGGTIPGIKRFVYSGTYTVPDTSGQWRFIFNGVMNAGGGGNYAGRATSITNINTAGSNITQITATLDNRFVNNSSPDLTNSPTPYFCQNNDNFYNPGGVDADGDSLVYSLTAGKLGVTTVSCTISGASVTYIGNAWTSPSVQAVSATTPLRVASASDYAFNVLNGQIFFNPNVVQRALVNYTVSEYRAGNLIGTSQREMTFLVQPCTTTPPTGGLSSATNGVIVDSVHYQVCAETGPFSFHLLPTSPDPTLNIKISATGIPAGATFTVINDSTPNPDATFNWTSTGVTPGLYTINVTYKDDQCPINGANTVPISITINNLADIAGTPVVCVGANTTLTNTTSGGSWSSANPVIASVGIGTGVVTGVTAGVTTISYSVGTCFKVMDVTVNPLPSAISGSLAICVGNTTTLNSTPAGGTWVSTVPTVSTITTSGGVATGLSAGTTIISYFNPATTCAISAVLTVNAVPGTISGPGTVCVGSAVTLNSTPAGGTWSSGFPANATVSGSGVVTGINAGTAGITYSLGSGCTTSRVMTINGLPNNINPPGATVLCEGNTAAFTNSTPGGTWSSSNTAVASVITSGSPTTVTGVGAGIATISYTNTATGCYRTKGVTVNTTPAAITPATASVCTGSTITLSNSVSGGVWTSSNTARATVNAATGDVTGVVSATAGTVNITYSIGTCRAIRVVTVNLTPAPIAPATPVSVCVGDVTTLTDPTPLGAWSSSNIGAATISSTGVVTGLALGTTNISYTVGSCSATKVVSVGVTPSTILPASPSVCVGGFTTLTNSVPGGLWSSGNLVVATVDATTGAVAGISIGTAVISYNVGSCFATTVISVNSTPTVAAISGPAVLCVSTSGGYTNTVPGGVWSTVLGNASITSGGIATGVTTGLDTIRYTVTSACGSATASYPVTINPLSSAGTISGPTSVCVSGLITLTGSVPGGIWSSSNGSATAGSTSGIITGIFPGLDTVTYTVSSVCGIASVTHIVTVNSLPTAGVISGPGSVCVSASIALSSSVSGGTWSAANANSTVGSTSGVVTGVTAGTNTITYTVSNSCGTAITTTDVTINPLPDAGTLSGPDSVCIGSSITLVPSVGGGAWTAGNANATVTGLGVVTGATAGTVPISYTVTNVCGTISAVKIITVVPPPNAGVISGPSAVCVGAGITLMSSAPAGTWSSSNANTTVSGPGIIVGVTVGTSVISYVVTNLCGTATATWTVSVNPVPVVAAITGPVSHCVGTTITKVNTTPGGVWTSSSMAIATVGLSTGIVNGVSAGVVDITYTVTNGFGCPASATAPDTVYAVPVVPAIAGDTHVCLGATTTLSNTTAGGTWSSANTAVASIDAAGVVSGITIGTTTISYTVNNICGTTSVTRVQTVVPLPVVAPVTGTTHQCEGGTTTLSSATTGGTWSSDDVSIATAGLSTGDITGVLAGITVITYTYTDALGCSDIATTPDTVIALPVVAPVTGTPEVCIGSVTTLACATAGGTWTSSDASIASVGSASGIVSGIAAGTATISYLVTNASGCVGYATAEVTVHPLPVVAPISGTMSVCVDAGATLSSAPAGGTWSSSDVATASVDAFGVVTGVSAGVATITYTFTDGLGCSGDAVADVTVNPLPVVPAITGSAMECVGATTTLSNPTAGGTWTSGSIGTAAVDAVSGVVTGVAAGTAIISYAISDGLGCIGYATIENTVNPLPFVAPITGVTHVCVGASAVLSNATPSGVWSSSDATIAAIDAAGVVSGFTGGIVTMSYSVTDGLGCTGVATTPDTVFTVPVSGPITGSPVTCIGATTALAGVTPFGVWSSSNPAVAAVDAAGVVTGMSAGTAVITYFVNNPCGTATDVVTVTVNTVPAAGTISALITTVCSGSGNVLSSTVPGGVWSSSDASIATVNATTGVVSALSAGTVTITYTVTSGGCSGFSTYTFTVGTPIPGTSVVPVGISSLCNGNPVNMHVTSLTPGLTYQWLLNGGAIAGATNSGYLADTIGSYSVIVNNGVCSQLLTGPDVVYMLLPVIGYTPPNILFTGSYAVYQWYRNGVAISGANSSIVHVTLPGTYSVIVEDGHGCTDTATYLVTGGGGGSTNVTTTTSLMDIRVYPNPATARLFIDAPVRVNVVITTMDGRKVMELQNATSVDVSKLAGGLYLVTISDENNLLLKTTKFSKTE